SAREVTGRGDDAAPAAANDQRLVGQRRIVTFLNCCVKGIAIDMRNGERIEALVAEQARGTAVSAARHSGRRVAETIAAESGCHGASRSQSGPLSAFRARSISSGGMPISAAKASNNCSSAA